MKPKEITENNMNRLRAISAFLKEYRINSGLSQQELSECSMVHRNTIVRLESCDPQNMTLLTIFEIADSLDVDIIEVFSLLE